MVEQWHQRMRRYMCHGTDSVHHDVIKWKHFPRYWPFVRVIHRWPVNSSHKGQWHGSSMFSLICAWIIGWVNNCEAGELRRHRAHYDVIVMTLLIAMCNMWHSVTMGNSVAVLLTRQVINHSEHSILTDWRCVKWMRNVPDICEKVAISVIWFEGALLLIACHFETENCHYITHSGAPNNIHNPSEIYRILHDDAIKWKHFPRYWPFVRGIQRSLVNSSHKASE